MRSILAGLVLSLALAPAVQAQQAERPPSEVTAEAAEAAAVAQPEAPRASAPLGSVKSVRSDLPARVEMVRPAEAANDVTDTAAIMQTTGTRNVLAIVGAIVIVIALVALLT